MDFDLYMLYAPEVCPLEYAEVQARRDEHQALYFAFLDQSSEIDEAMLWRGKTAWYQAEAACRTAFATRRPELSSGIENIAGWVNGLNFAIRIMKGSPF